MNLRRYGALAAALTLAVGLTACGSSDDESGSGSDNEAKAPTELTLALVPSSDQKKLVEDLSPLTDFLTDELGVPVEGVVSSDYAAAVEAIGANQAQIGFLPPLPMYQAADRYDAVNILQVVRFGSGTYNSQFFTNNPDKYCTESEPVEGMDADGQGTGMLYCNGTEPVDGAPAKGPIAIETIAAAKDAKISLQDASSSSGYIYPALAFKDLGIEVSDLDVLTTGGHDASVAAVYDGDAEVGVSFNDARGIVSEEKPDVGQKVVVFALTPEIGNDGVTVSAELPKEWQTKISDALLAFADTDEGKATLDAIYEIDGFAPADEDSIALVGRATEELGLTG